MISENLKRRFWEKVNKTEGCWIWSAGLRRGWGRITEDGNSGSLVASRVSWEIHFGEIPSGLSVLHKCDNRACVNPSHLFLGTQKDNMVDMVEKGRCKPPTFYGEDSTAAKLDWRKVDELRKRREKEKLSYRMLGAIYGISHTQARHICGGRYWVPGRTGIKNVKVATNG